MKKAISLFLLLVTLTLGFWAGSFYGNVVGKMDGFLFCSGAVRILNRFAEEDKASREVSVNKLGPALRIFHAEIATTLSELIEGFLGRSIFKNKLDEKAQNEVMEFIEKNKITPVQ